MFIKPEELTVERARHGLHSRLEPRASNSGPSGVLRTWLPPPLELHPLNLIRLDQFAPASCVVRVEAWPAIDAARSSVPPWTR